MKPKPLIIVLLLIVVGGMAVFFTVERQKELAAEERHRAVQLLALDDLKRDCEQMQAELKESKDSNSIGKGFTILSYEMNVRSAIEGTLDRDSVRDYSVALQGPLTPEIKLRVMAEAARRIEQAEKTYDLAHSSAVSHIF